MTYELNLEQVLAELDKRDDIVSARAAILLREYKKLLEAWHGR